MLKTVKIHSYEVGIHFRDGECKGLLDTGRHWFFDPLQKVHVDVVSQRNTWLTHEKLDVIVKLGVLKDRATVLDLTDRQRALVWIDGRFSCILPPGLYAYWTTFHQIVVEVIDVDTEDVRFQHKDLQVIVRSASADRVLDTFAVEQGQVGVLFQDGNYMETLPPGKYAFWKNAAKVAVAPIDLRETMLDIGGQEVMTADKVSLRVNAVVTYRVADAHKALSSVDDVRQALYREAQLALRALIGASELDRFLANKDTVADEAESAIRRRVTALGLEVVSLGIRDVILPGDMKDLMNKVTEAKKAAEANLIARREETAATRSQVNTAKLIEDNPTLMRLRELEVLEKVAANSKLNVMLSEKGLAERVVNLL